MPTAQQAEAEFGPAGPRVMVSCTWIDTDGTRQERHWGTNITAPVADILRGVATVLEAEQAAKPGG